MNILNKIKLAFESPKAVLTIVLNRIGPLIKNDELFLRLKWKLKMGYPINLDNPHTFNEKLQWLKLHDRKPIYATMVDKYEAKKYVANIIGEEYIIPTLAVYDRVEDIDFDALPNQFVLKCTHDSGGLVICRDKSKLDKKSAIKKLRKYLKRTYFWQNREWPYKNVNPRIIAEQYMEDKGTKELRDYKFFCFNGIMKALFIASDRQTEGEETKFDFFDADFRHLDIRNGHPNADMPPAKPETFDKMKKMAEKLSEHIPHLRVDFYEVNGKAYFGELTFSHWSGMKLFNPEKWDMEFGQWIALPETDGGGNLYLSDGIVLYLHSLREETPSLTDYKFYCFNGEAKYLYVSEGLENHSTAKISFLTLDWKFAPFCRFDYAPFKELPPKPSKFNEMIKIAEQLSKGHTFLRVDLYEINNQIYFGELTFHPCSGMMPFKPKEWDLKFGELVTLPNRVKDAI
jgi:hypothetical protein